MNFCLVYIDRAARASAFVLGAFVIAQRVGDTGQVAG
jgi:hypothetical protein